MGQSESVMLEQDSWYALLVSHAVDAIISINDHSIVQLWNPAAEKMFGYSRAEAVGRNITTLIIPPEFRDRHNRGMDHLLATGEGPLMNRTIEITAQRRDQTTLPIELSLFQIDEAPHPQFTGIIRDISERKRLERELEARNQELDALLSLRTTQLAIAGRREELAREIIESIRYETDLDTILQLTVDRMGEFADADRCTIWLYDETLQGFTKPAHEYRRGGDIAPLRETSAPERMVIPEGLSCEETISVSDVTQMAGLTPQDWISIRERNIVSLLHVPIRYRDKLLGVLRVHTTQPHEWDADTIALVSATAGQIAVAVYKAQVLHELQVSQARLKEYAIKLERSNQELESFAAVASHDLQTPLRKIILFTEQLRVDYAQLLPEEGLEVIERLQRATRKMQALITDLLTLSRITRKAQPFQSISLDTVLEEVLVDLEAELESSGGRIEVGEMLTLDADASQMGQLLQNLLGNALKFHKPGIPPVVHIHASRLNESTAQIVVSDNGIGFDEKYRDRIFTVFERLHADSEYEGTGIGLAICQKIAERHGGQVTATSREGEGSEFIVMLPLRHDDPGNSEPS